MRTCILSAIVFISFLECFSQELPILSFPLHPNDLELTRSAQPFQYFDKIGKKAGLMGLESGSFEMWVWPWKVLRNFELSFLLGTSTQPILAKDIVRTISVTPEATTLTYTYESFTVRERIIVPRNEPGAILLLEVYSTTPLTIVAGFLPVMQPMWPAGIGGQFSYWDDAAGAYVISEGQWRAVFLCGATGAKQMAAPPAHMFADTPLQFKMEIEPEARDRFVPIVIAGGAMNTDSAKAIYRKLRENPHQYYEENYEYYKALRSSTLQVITLNKEFNLAFEWGKVALDNLMIENPSLGYGMVAGYGLSGGGGRPGFAWFFGGDAFINSLAMNSYGAHQTVRDALAFTQRWQRQENSPVRKKTPDQVNHDVGKMAHELSQSEGLCDWWNDYHYGYNHADTTPWYLVAMGDYVRTSGDVGFLRQSWPSIKQAYDWCVSKDSDGDGLMDLKGAGLGALEFGKLVGIYADVYTCGVWVQGIKEMIEMAQHVGDAEMTAAAQAQLKKALPGLEQKFWIEDLGYYSYGATEKGEQVRELTPWPGVAMMFDLLDKARTHKSFEKTNSAELCTDWGVRSLARSSTLFEPTNYNYGAVWPFIASFFNTAQFQQGQGLSAYPILEANVRHAFDHGLGTMPEVFSGELNEKLGEAYHHQGFSTTGYVLPLVRGMLGLEVDVPNNSIALSPNLPANWDTVRIKNVGVGDSAYDFDIVQSDTMIAVRVTSMQSSTVNLTFAPHLPKGLRPGRGLVNGEEKFDLHSELPAMQWMVRNGDVLSMHYFAPRYAVLPPSGRAPVGTTNSSLKIISHEYAQPSWTTTRLTVEGLAGRTYAIEVLRPEMIQSVTGVELQGNSFIISFDGKSKSGFVRKVIGIERKQGR